MKRPLLALAALAALMLMPSRAAAQLELCNRTSYILYTATAVQERDGVTTQGWSRIVPGDCKTVIETPLGKNRYFVYARTSTAHGGAPRDWSGNMRLCAAEANFRLKSAIGTTLCSAESSALPFAEVQTGGQSVWTTSFTESPAISTVDQARTAGLKRLLKDNGAKIDLIDGKPNQQTGNALSAFRKRTKLAANAPVRDMFDALETEALRTAAPAGYSICNDTDGDIWAVIAFKVRDYVSRGWWKVAAGSCAKAITTALHVDAVYLHVEKHGNPKLVSGAEKFCLTNMQFEVEGRGNCGKRGLTETSFATTNTKGLAGYVAHVGNSGLVAPIKLPAPKPAKPPAAKPKPPAKPKK